VLVRQRQEIQALPRSLTLTDIHDSRVLEWDGCFNVRDLGGLAAADGQHIRWGALVRSDLPCRLSQRGREELVGHGVRTIVDLRFPHEVASDWDSYPFKDGSDGIAYRNVPFNTGRDPEQDDIVHAAYQAATSRAQLNRHDIDWNSVGIATAVAAVADAPEGGVLVHCHAGKDRTGAVIAVILPALGVSDDDIADDYSMTARWIEPLIVDWLDSTSQDPLERDRLRTLAMPAREAMLDTLDYLRQRHATAADYLVAGGATTTQLTRLNTRLVERD